MYSASLHKSGTLQENMGTLPNLVKINLWSYPHINTTNSIGLSPNKS